MYKKVTECFFCGDPIPIEQQFTHSKFCSDECALAELTGDETFVYEDGPDPNSPKE